MTDKDISQRAEEYIASLDNEIDESRKEELEKEIKRGEEKYDNLVQEHGEEHKLAERAEEILDTRRNELEEIREREEQLGTAREEFLRSVVDKFELNEEWLQPKVIKAVTQALYAEQESSYKLFGEAIQNTDDMEGLDEFDRIERAEVVILLAKDSLDQSDAVSEQWKRLEDSKSYMAFEVLAENGSLSSEEVAEILDESKGTVNNWLKNPINLWDRLIPFYRVQKGKYGLSTTGRYFCEHYYKGATETTEAKASQNQAAGAEADSSKPADEQVTLGTTATQSTETATAEDEEGHPGETDLSEIEDTDEKADAMFSKVSDEADN